MPLYRIASIADVMREAVQKAFSRIGSLLTQCLAAFQRDYVCGGR